jgi:hypothetical protein
MFLPSSVTVMLRSVARGVGWLKINECVLSRLVRGCHEAGYEKAVVGHIANRSCPYFREVGLA